jgi:hypothetical protein
VTDAGADSILDRASDVAGIVDFGEDVACCTTFVRGGSVRTFGAAGDGRDSLDSDQELRAVLDLTVARVKVVRIINHCAGPGTNILGCSYTPGFGMAVVRTGNEGILWLHEYGHNTGLDHDTDSRYVMYSFLVSTALGLRQTQCNRYHSPPDATDATPRDVGVCSAQSGCTDADEDGYGNPGSTACPAGAQVDCNDANAAVNPGERDLCNAVDDNCSGAIDELLCSTLDVNGDGRVATSELAWTGRAFGACSSNPSAQWWAKADYDLDGCVDGQDLAVLAQAWACSGTQRVCP